jgi:hypothetical protein
MVDRNLNDLDSKFRPLAAKIMVAGNAAIAPSKAAIIVTWRSDTDQKAAKAKGLSKAGPGDSPHNCCLVGGIPAARAFDFAVFDEDGKYVTDGTDARYATVGRIALSVGLTWGGMWRPETDDCEPDFDHIEMPAWRSA